MKTLLLSLALFGFVAVAPAFAGGGFEPGQAGNTSGGGSATLGASVAPSSALGIGAPSNNVTANASGTESNPASSSSSSSTIWQIALVVAIVAVAGGLLVWSYRRNKIV